MRNLVLIAAVAMAGACCPTGSEEAQKLPDAGDGGSHTDAGPDVRDNAGHRATATVVFQ